MEWIKKCDQLPKEGEYVLIHPPYRCTVFSEEPRHVVRWKNGRFIYYSNNYIQNVSWKDITHWMPLPQNPKQED